MLFFDEVACFFFKRLRDCVCVERLPDFCVWGGCVIFLTHSLTQVAGFIFLEVA